MGSVELLGVRWLDGLHVFGEEVWVDIFRGGGVA